MLNTLAIPHALTRQIIQRAGGNPFFIEEVVRSLIDRGAIVRREGGFEVTEKISEIPIPNTINDVLMSRIDRLEEKTKDLVKVASVIGRNFFYRILSDVANEVEDINGRLSYLTGIQIMQESRRMGEVEYLFKHALAQEAAYESILPLKRRELHRSVAHSIEKIFKERLHEFYGMLAYHYSRAEDLEKSEEYLIKAGEEALRSAASDEALHYYEEALQLYLQKSGPDADPEKVAMLEKNIGLALFNRGHYAEAVEHFDKALNFYWGQLPQNVTSTTFKFLSSFATFLLAVYFPFRWFKRMPTARDTEVIDLFYKKAEALVVINPKRFFIETIFSCGTIVHFDLTKFRFGIATFVGTSGIFSFTGLSQGLAKKILDYAKPQLVPADARQSILYDIMHTAHLFLKGQWDQVTECNEDLVKRNLKIGEMAWTSQYYYWHGLAKIYQGHFDGARQIVTELTEIAEAYDNDIYRLLKYLLTIQLHIECRHLKEAAEEVNRGIDLVQKKNWALSGMTMHALKAWIFLLTREMDEAGKSLDRANQIRFEVRAVPFQLSFLYRSQFYYHLRRLEDSLENGLGKEIAEHRQDARKSGKMLAKACRRAALFRTEYYRLMGTYKWLVQDRKSACSFWQKGRAEGERLGASPHLARMCAEMGMRLCGTPDGPELAGVAKELLQKAKTMFGDLGLQHDLENLDRVIHRIGPEPSD